MSQCADNFRFDITAWRGHYADGRDMLEDCLKIALGGHLYATHWSVSADNKKLTLYWSDPKKPGAVPLLSRANLSTIATYVRVWLHELGREGYGPEPDHDGSNSMGWRIYNEAWGHVDDCPYAICAIEPEWLWHGK